jgi:hypothetical protein
MRLAIAAERLTGAALPIGWLNGELAAKGRQPAVSSWPA